ncbi:MAG: AAA family ATPase [Saprospiraceae bacterium]|nr:AAA family ATPase [Saprospiraceae bacterium]
MDLEGLNKLLGISERLVEAAKHDFVRYLYADINFGARMLMVKGGRGVGKTTLLLQYLHSLKDQSQCAYLSLDHLFSPTTAYRL